MPHAISISQGRPRIRFYAGNIELVCRRGRYLNGQLQHIAFPDGRLVAEYNTSGTSVTGYRSEYFRTDHLGNTRLTFSDFNQDGLISWKLPADGPSAQESEITSENHYYPFGLSQKGPWYASVAPENKYRYNGKEWNDDWGLNMYDYGARGYMPDLGRWGGVDALAERYHAWSQYNYVMGNPMLLIDPDGMRISLFDRLEAMGAKHGDAPDWVPDKQGNLLAEAGDDALTLSDYLGISYEESDAIFSNLQNWANKTDREAGIVEVEGKTLLISDKGLRAGNLAEYYIGSTAWNTDVTRGDYAEGVNKCNVFCGEILKQAGISPGTPNIINPKRALLPWVGKKYGFPLAGQWADPYYHIPGWEVLRTNETPRRGDIAAYSFNYSDASGHVAIVLKSGYTVGTSGSQRQIAKTDFGFNPDRSNNLPIIFRRFTGK
jgi:RHS repeat-associated protein